MFLGYIHYFRAIAILFIVAGHSIDVLAWSEDRQLERIFRILMSNGSVLFIFIAGYLFQYLSNKYEIKKYYTSKAKNVITPYFLISIPSIFIFVAFIERDVMWTGFYDNPVWAQISLFYLTGKHLGPFWFIPMITIFYIIAPILIRADKNKLIYYMLPVFIILSCFIDRGLPHQSFVHFFSAYLLGMYCSKFRDSINPLISNNIFILLSLSLLLFLATTEFLYMEETMTYLNYLQKITMSMFFLGLLIKLNKHLNSKLVSTIADTSFGIFFIHPYLLFSVGLLQTKTQGHLLNGTIPSYILVTISVLLICSFLIVQAKKLLGDKSKYFVGS